MIFLTLGAFLPVWCGGSFAQVDAEHGLTFAPKINKLSQALMSRQSDGGDGGDGGAAAAPECARDGVRERRSGGRDELVRAQQQAAADVYTFRPPQTASAGGPADKRGGGEVAEQTGGGGSTGPGSGTGLSGAFHRRQAEFLERQRRAQRKPSDPPPPPAFKPLPRSEMSGAGRPR